MGTSHGFYLLLASHCIPDCRYRQAESNADHTIPALFGPAHVSSSDHVFGERSIIDMCERYFGLARSFDASE